MICLDDLATFLREVLPARAGDDGVAPGLYEPPGVPAQRARPVRRLGLALEPWPALPSWAEREALDALFLHRPWGVEDLELPSGVVGVLAAHEAFDRHLGIGRSRALAEELGLTGLQACGWKRAAPLGWVGALVGRPRPFPAFVRRALRIFGGVEVVHPPRRRRVNRVAVMGALREGLLEEAEEAGAEVYVTGQWRLSAGAAVGRSAMGVVAVGHRRSERWGLRALAGAFARRFAHLHVACAPPRPADGPPEAT